MLRNGSVAGRVSIGVWFLAGLAVSVSSRAGQDAPSPRLEGKYHLKWVSRLTLESAADGFRIAGELSVTLGGIRLSNLDCASPESEERVALRRVCADLEGAYPWRLRDDGGLERIGLRTDHLLPAEAILKDLAALVQLTAPPIAGAKRWSRREYDPLGEYEAEYERRGTTVIRRKSRYLRVTGDDGLRLPEDREITGSGTTWVELGSGTVRRLVHEEGFQRRPPRGFELPRSSYELRLVLERQDGEVPSMSREDSERPRLWVSPGDPGSEQASQRMLDEQRAAGQSYGELRHLLASRPRDDADGQKRFDRSLLALVSVLRLDEAASSNVVDDCRRLAAWCGASVAALGAAGSPGAQTALMRIYRHLAPSPGSDTRERARLRREVVRGLGTRLLASPLPATLQFLIDQQRDPTVGKQATYGLGALAGREWRSGRFETSSACLEPLGQRLRDAISPLERVTLLRALSNAGTPAVEPLVTPYLSDPNPSVAKVASQSLQAVSPAE